MVAAEEKAEESDRESARQEEEVLRVQALVRKDSVNFDIHFKVNIKIDTPRKG